MYKRTNTFFENPSAPSFGLILLAAAWVAALSLAGCGPTSISRTDTPFVIGPEFRSAVEAGATRDPERIAPHLLSADPAARSYAWRSVAFSQPPDPERWIDLALQTESADAWHALARLSIQDEAVRRSQVLKVRTAIERDSTPDAGSDHDSVAAHRSLEAKCQFVAVQGAMEDARWLMDRFSPDAFDRFPRCALAVGMLAAADRPIDSDLDRIVALIGAVGSTDAAKGFAYTFSRVARHRPAPGSERHRSLETFWTGRHAVGTDAELDAWMARALGPSALRTIWNSLGAAGIAGESVRATEMARLVRDLPLEATSEDDRQLVATLLGHSNAAVAVVLADGFADRPVPDALRGLFEEELEAPSNPERHLAVLRALLNGMSPESRRVLLESRRSELATLARLNPYLAGRMAPFWSQLETREQTFERLERGLEAGGLQATDAITSLPALLLEGPDPDSDAEERIRTMVWRALERGERGPAFQTEPLLIDDGLFPPSDDFIEAFTGRILETYHLPQDIEVYQMAERVLSTRGAAEPIRQAMALHAEQSATSEGTRFRSPDWEQLERLGAHPTLTLETEKGRIVVRLETLTAPYTVSALAALASQGAYDGVPFHRVVPNFVIQGGDVESADGFGGPGFTIPTEISTRSFQRGRLGIASAGPDTEGSQYFIMHAWAPHLDGRYSSLGEVLEGMDVVDAIQVGDRVIQMELK